LRKIRSILAALSFSPRARADPVGTRVFQVADNIYFPGSIENCRKVSSMQKIRLASEGLQRRAALYAVDDCQRIDALRAEEDVRNIML
jgi:hypothetical protein